MTKKRHGFLLYACHGSFPASHVRGGSVSRRGLNRAYRRRPTSQAEPSKQKRPKPNASRSSGGSAREGKDSHSRQWRLSMAVFLNRNKRPQAAPIEVAELLSEKPPPSHTPTSVPLFGRGGLGERRFSLEKRPLPQSPRYSSIAFARSLRAASLSWEPRRVTVGSTTVISFIWASTPFMVLTAEGPQEPFSIRPKVRF